MVTTLYVIGYDAPRQASDAVRKEYDAVRKEYDAVRKEYDAVRHTGLRRAGSSMAILMVSKGFFLFW